ncbi:Sodium/calcium exchanger protein-domain-containing protein [Halteromyces radiatus]|uniref:Sodium/calcium exchanger protein-domain-containing protein n=1 Tax=Halteromyces radiatus TaxID=101107 RepID=UPI00222012AD|nr:Sodium/calcium exchanger protein-domain-containing protein [Halteromyces radiatus]KAI8096385.1 Sodium/calcium exchanger protein-domain-containing protein [Halteromyces radiatus]
MAVVGRTTVLLISLYLFTYFFTSSWQQKHTLYKRDAIIENKCDNIYQYDDQCTYVLEHCQDTTPGLINYIQLYYCSSTVGKPIIFLFLCTWLLFLFGFVGIAASDFFCPNLQTIASALHLSESLTGVTFLAFGNGSPDLFSTFTAMNSNMGSLALGELIGAASFIVSVVAGSMCAIKPFRAKKHSFLRDVSFFTLSIIMVLIIVADGLIYLYEAILLIVFYILYVALVVGGNYFMKRRSNYMNLIQRARSEYEENGPEVDSLLLGNIWDGSDQQSDEMELYDEGFETEGYQDYTRHDNALPGHMKLRIRTSLFSAIEFQDVVKSLQRTNMSHRYTSIRRRHHQQTRFGNGTEGNTNVPLTPQGQPPNYQQSASVETLGFDHQSISQPWNRIRLALPVFVWDNLDDLNYHLFPSLGNFDDKSIFNKISSVISAPMIFLLVITLPVVKGTMKDEGGDVALNDDTLTMLEDYYSDTDNIDLTEMDSVATSTAAWSRWLTALQLVGSSVLFGLVLAINKTIPAVIILPVMMGSGLLLSGLFLSTTSQQHRPRLYWMMCFVGFAMAVLWIYIIANEVVSVLQAIGMALGVSEAILGLTVFAVGNSLGDFVANVTMARMGYPLMAMSACFGGPMLNIMLGIGIGATYVTCQRQEPYAIDVSSTIIVSSIGLLIVLISSLVFVPLNGYRMSKWFGYTWIGIYLITMMINLILELRS